MSAIVKRINKYNYGPITDRPLDCVVMTGDGTDNRATIELEWLLTLLSGGSFYANTGDSAKFEDVGSFQNPYYWLPDSSHTDLYKHHGFPVIPDFYSALLETPVESPGLNTRWYSLIGNHDSCFMGAFPHALKTYSLYTRGRKIVQHDVDDIVGTAYEGTEDLVENITGELLRGKAEIYEDVTPDERRAPFTRETFVKMHHEERFVGAGPAGHGLPEVGRLYYTFPITDEIDGIVLDTNFPAGAAGGWMGGRQMEWLKASYDSAPTTTSSGTAQW